MNFSTQWLPDGPLLYGWTLLHHTLDSPGGLSAEVFLG